MEIPERGKDGIILRVAAFHDSDFHRFRGVGFIGTADPGTTTDISIKIESSRAMNGCAVILKDHVFGDKLSFYIIDKDNLLGLGAGAILDSFCENWYLSPDSCGQKEVILPYKANLVAGLYLVLRYHSVGQSAVQVACNLYLHTKEGQQ